MEKASRRNELLRKGRTIGLDRKEANELREILEEEAREQFDAGKIGTFGFVVVLFIIGALSAALLRKI